MTAMRATIIQRPTPLEKIREAIDWAARAGITVDVGPAYGVRSVVLCGERRWIREHGLRGFVSPIGAVVLREQPRAVMMPEAAAEAMGVSVPWIEGFNAGAARLDLERQWLAGFSAQTALAGYEAGTQVRAMLLSAVCAKHGCRYSRVGGVCPSCEVAETHRGDDYPTHGSEP